MRQKTFSQTRPEKNFIIENVENGKCTVLFFDNIEEIEQEDEERTVQYSYDLYKVSVPYREGLQDEIESKYNTWLEFAKDCDYEIEAAKIRQLRDKILADTDWTQMKDTSLSEEKQRKYQVYRQLLRDVPEQEGFPYDVEFPVLEGQGD